MKKVVATICFASLAGCSSGPEYRTQDLIIDRHIPAMSRNEVIMAIQDCESNGLRAVLINGKRRINGFTADVVVDITCAPKLKY
jgi:hypothetical protein